MSTIHVSEAEAVRDLASLLSQARAGAEIVIEGDLYPAVTIRAAAEPGLRRLSHSLQLAREHASAATLDGGFGCDLESVVDSHSEPAANLWD